MAVELMFGMSGSEVKTLQAKLNEKGYDCGAVDGIFGPKTDRAVKNYQRAMGLEVDGIVGPKTWAALNASGEVKRPETEHFKYSEFECPDGTPIPQQYWPDLQTLMNQLEILRHTLGDKPIIIRSGYRSPAYNAKVGGEGGSQHLYAAAADIYCPNRLPNCYQIGEKAYEQFYKGNVGGVGLGANVNVHVDVRGARSLWWYNYKSWTSWAANQGARG